MAQKYHSTYPQHGDDVRVLLAKLDQYLTSGSIGSMSEHFSSNAPNTGDAIRTLLAKILIVMNGGGGGGSGGGGKSGTGSPEGVVTAAPGTTYLDASTGAFWAKKTGTGNTGWIELIA